MGESSAEIVPGTGSLLGRRPALLRENTTIRRLISRRFSPNQRGRLQGPINPFDRHGLIFAPGEFSSRRFDNLLRDHDLSPIGAITQPRRCVDRAADCGVLHPLGCTDRPHNRISGVNPNSDSQLAVFVIIDCLV